MWYVLIQQTIIFSTWKISDIGYAPVFWTVLVRWYALWFYHSDLAAPCCVHVISFRSPGKTFDMIKTLSFDAMDVKGLKWPAKNLWAMGALVVWCHCLMYYGKPMATHLGSNPVLISPLHVWPVPTYWNYHNQANLPADRVRLEVNKAYLRSA